MANSPALSTLKPHLVGIFGGSFNPPHLGHRRIAHELLERGIVDEIWFVPCKNHVFAKTLAPDQERLSALADLIASLPKKTRIKSRVELYEISQSKQLSVSYHTLCHFQQLYPDYTFQFIIGSDQVATFPQWHHYQALLQQFPVLVYPRAPYLQPPLLPNMIFLSDFPIVDISSTQIRQLQAAGDLSWKKLVVLSEN